MKSTKFLLLLVPVAAAAITFLPTPSPFANAEQPIKIIPAAKSGAPAAVELAGIRLPEATKVGGEDLVLNGAAIRTKYGFKVYVAGLYLTEESQDDQHIMGKDRNGKRVHITLMRNVKNKKFKQTVRDNIDVNFSSAEQRQYASEISAFLGCFPDGSSLEKDSHVNIDFHPGEGTKVVINDRPAEVIPGDEFYHTLLRLWIGKPLQASIKEGLLAKTS